MLFVALYTMKPGVSTAQSLKARMEWKPPQGMKPVAEFWLQNSTPHIIVAFEADNIAQLMATNMPWRDLCDITVTPAITGEEGLKLAKQMMPKA